MHRYKVWNGPAPTTAAQARTSTGTAIKTHLQVATPSTRQCMVLAWGFSVEVTPTSGASVIELVETDVAATVTAHVAAGFVKIDPNAPNTLMTLGTAASGYNASAEGTITATRVFDAVELPPTAGAYDNNYRYQFTAAERPIVAVSKFLRVRTTFATSQNFLCWAVIDE